MSLVLRSEISRLIEDLANVETIVFWGAGRKVPRLLQDLCGKSGLMKAPMFITDSTRHLAESEFGIPTIPFDAVKELKPDTTLIVITAGLLDLQGHVIRNGLYYHRVIDHTALEQIIYLRDHPENIDLATKSFRTDSSRQLFLELLLRRTLGVVWSPDLFSPNPYFSNEWIPAPPSHGTVYFAGAFNGNHIERIKQANSVTRVNAFEPSTKWSVRTKDRFSTDLSIEVEQGILSSASGTLYLYEDVPNDGLAATVYDSDSHSEERVPVQAITIDEHAQGEAVSQIILDVEGSEEEVLWGAKQQIRENRPFLTICCYHTPKQFMELPLVIEKIAPGRYDLELLHHSCVTGIETVVYALPK